MKLKEFQENRNFYSLIILSTSKHNKLTFYIKLSFVWEHTFYYKYSVVMQHKYFTLFTLSRLDR